MNFIQFLPLLCISFVLIRGINGSYKTYSYFDDYLNSLGEEQQSKITGEAQDIEGSGAEPDSQQVMQSFNLPLRTAHVTTLEEDLKQQPLCQDSPKDVL
ncbi:hypothetical protein TNCV_4942551 [Trichonephila clavipes]|nr:hypothetical protein TNCV_4942551 [Trichonephila clavipes]